MPDNDRNEKQTRPIRLTCEFALELAIELTAQPDYLALTTKLLECLHEIPTVSLVRVFEVHNKHKKKGLAGVATEDLIVHEVLNDLDELQPFDDIASLNRSVQRLREGADKGERDSFQQVLLPIPGAVDQMRVVLIEAEYIDLAYWELIHRLLDIYGNQLMIFDEKERDQLTGLYNRQTFEEKLARVMSFYRARAQHSGRVETMRWLAVLDIDHFKSVNDNFGHMIGDEVLLLFSRIMESTFRQTDMLFRYGGEEFVVILNGCSIDGALIALERFRTKVADNVFPQVGQVTVSIGYVCLEDNVLSSTLIDQADQALYYAKENGRNQTISYSSIAGESSAQEGDIELF